MNYWMMKFKHYLHLLIQTNVLKTLYLNFYYFKLRDAVKMPILVAKRTQLETVGGGKNSRSVVYWNVDAWL